MTILAANGTDLTELHDSARAHPTVLVVALDDAMLSTNAYEAYASDIQARPLGQFSCFGLILAGTKSAIRKLTGGLQLYGA